MSIATSDHGSISKRDRGEAEVWMAHRQRCQLDERDGNHPPRTSLGVSTSPLGEHE